MSRIVFVHGFKGNPEGSTFTAIKNLQPNAEFISKQFDLFNPEKTLQEIKELNPDILIGNSLGAFYVLAYPSSCAKIVINPCLKPWIEIPKLIKDKDINLPEGLLEKWENEYNYFTEQIEGETRQITFGIFGQSDELFSCKDEFWKLYRNSIFEVTNTFSVPGKHHLSEHPKFSQYLERGFEYFDLLSQRFFLADYLMPWGDFPDPVEDADFYENHTITYQSLIEAQSNFHAQAEAEKILRDKLSNPD